MKKFKIGSRAIATVTRKGVVTTRLTGKITDISETARGVWFRVADRTGAAVKVRQAQLSAA